VTLDGMRIIASSDAVTVAVEPFGIDHLRARIGERGPAQGWYCPRFGTAIPAPALEMRIERNDGQQFGYRIHLLSKNP
jgi:hypothetical protein